jgi:hypothetical protein
MTAKSAGSPRRHASRPALLFFAQQGAGAQSCCAVTGNQGQQQPARQHGRADQEQRSAGHRCLVIQRGMMPAVTRHRARPAASPSRIPTSSPATENTVAWVRQPSGTGWGRPQGAQDRDVA